MGKKNKVKKDEHNTPTLPKTSSSRVLSFEKRGEKKKNKNYADRNRRARIGVLILFVLRKHVLISVQQNTIVTAIVMSSTN